MTAAYAEAAAALHELGDRMAALAENAALDGTRDNPSLWLTVMPGWVGAHADNAAIIDVVAQALLGKPGKVQYRQADGQRYKADGNLGPISVSVHGLVPDPAAADKDAEIARLRAELAAALAGARAQQQDGQPRVIQASAWDHGRMEYAYSRHGGWAIANLDELARLAGGDPTDVGWSAAAPDWAGDGPLVVRDRQIQDGGDDA